MLMIICHIILVTPFRTSDFRYPAAELLSQSYSPIQVSSISVKMLLLSKVHLHNCVAHCWHSLGDVPRLHGQGHLDQEIMGYFLILYTVDWAMFGVSDTSFGLAKHSKNDCHDVLLLLVSFHNDEPLNKWEQLFAKLNPFTPGVLHIGRATVVLIALAIP